MSTIDFKEIPKLYDLMECSIDYMILNVSQLLSYNRDILDKKIEYRKSIIKLEKELDDINYSISKEKSLSSIVSSLLYEKKKEIEDEIERYKLYFEKNSTNDDDLKDEIKYYIRALGMLQKFKESRGEIFEVDKRNEEYLKKYD